MALLSDAAIAMWWDINGVTHSEFEDWHTHEHMPERLRVPGFLRGTRWVSVTGGPRYYVMYEVRNLETISSPVYLERLNNPTSWTAKMMPHFRNMTRSACRVRASYGSGAGVALLSLRFSAIAGKENTLTGWLTKKILPELAARPGMAGAHVLQAARIAGLPRTKEQELRGGDAVADWVLLANGYDPSVVETLPATTLSNQSLSRHGAASGSVCDLYQLAHVLTRADLARSD